MRILLLTLGWIIDGLLWLLKPRIYIVNPKELTEEDKKFFEYLHADIKLLRNN